MSVSCSGQRSRSWPWWKGGPAACALPRGGCGTGDGPSADRTSPVPPLSSRSWQYPRVSISLVTLRRSVFQCHAGPKALSSATVIGNFPRRIFMAASSSPTVRRRQLATELKRLRLAAKMTIEQVAERLEWSPGKISKIENARVSVLPRDTRHLLDIYGIGEGPEREALLALARQSRERGWWQQYGEAVPEWFQTYVGLEAAASTISAYQAEYVPGLLQTEAYATAVHRAQLMNADEGEISKQVAVRMARQARLAEPDAPQLWVVLNEAVVRRVVGERAVMQAQLAKLSEL